MSYVFVRCRKKNSENKDEKVILVPGSQILLKEFLDEKEQGPFFAIFEKLLPEDYAPTKSIGIKNNFYYIPWHSMEHLDDEIVLASDVK